MDPTVDVGYLRETIAVAAKAKEKGNHPFGAILVDADGRVVAEGENTAGHSENPTQDLPCTVVFGAGQRKVGVRGPYDELAREIAADHRGFWSNRGAKSP